MAVVVVVVGRVAAVAGPVSIVLSLLLRVQLDYVIIIIIISACLLICFVIAVKGNKMRLQFDQIHISIGSGRIGLDEIDNSAVCL